MQKKTLIKKVLQFSREAVHSNQTKLEGIRDVNTNDLLDLDGFQTRRLKLNFADNNAIVKQNQKPLLKNIHSTKLNLNNNPVLKTIKLPKIASQLDVFSNRFSSSETRHYNVVANRFAIKNASLTDRFFTVWSDRYDTKNTDLGLGKIATQLKKVSLCRTLDTQSQSNNLITKSSIAITERKPKVNYAPMKGLSLDLTQALFFDRDSTFKSSDRFASSRSEGTVPLSLNLAHPQQYSNLLGYRTTNAVVNPYVTLQSIRRFLHYLKNVLSVDLLKTDNIALNRRLSNSPSQGPVSSELIIVLESSLLSSLSKQYVASIKTIAKQSAPFARPQPKVASKVESNKASTTAGKDSDGRLNYQKLDVTNGANKQKNMTAYSKSGATDLLFYCLLRLLGPALALNESVVHPSGQLVKGEKTQCGNLKISLKTAKETISYLAQSRPDLATQKTDVELVGVLMISPAKSVLGTLASQIFTSNGSNHKKLSTANALGLLCSKKGIPLISLCDITSPVNFSTYPIICDTSNINSLYVVFDLLTYGLNKLARPKVEQSLFRSNARVGLRG